MRLNNPARYRKTQSCSRGTPCRQPARPEKLVEDTLAQLRRYTRPFVFNCDLQHLRSQSARGHFDLSRGRRILRGVVDQAIENLRDSPRVHAKGWEFLFNPKFDLMPASQRLRAIKRGGDDFFNRAPTPSKIELAGLDPRKLEQAFNETIQAIRFLVNHLEHLAPAFAVERRRIVSVRSQLVEQSRDRRFYRSQRRSNVVGHRVQQR